MNMHDYIPDLPPPVGGVRGAYQYVSPVIIQTNFWHQHGIIVPRCFSVRYILPDDGWMHEALAKFHAFNLAVTGKQPHDLYQPDVYVCMEFAWDFKAFLHTCHVLHWQKDVGNAKMAVGFGATGVKRSPEIPSRHAMILIVKKTRDGYAICGKEPQLAMSPQSDYGVIEDCSSFTDVLF